MLPDNEINTLHHNLYILNVLNIALSLNAITTCLQSQIFICELFYVQHIIYN